MLKLFIVVVTFTFGVCSATPNCPDLHKTQYCMAVVLLRQINDTVLKLAALNERMSQMIDALYSSPLLAKLRPPTTSPSSSELSSNTSSEETSRNKLPTAYAPSTTSSQAPQVMYSFVPTTIPMMPRLSAPVMTSVPAFYALEGPIVSPRPQPSYFALDRGIQPTEYSIPTPSYNTRRSVWPEPSYPSNYRFPNVNTLPQPLPRPTSVYPQIPPQPFPHKPYHLTPYQQQFCPQYPAQPDIQANYV